jgi:MFS family permease
VIRLWLAAFCSETGEWMLQIALPVLVFQTTGSVASTATMMVVGLLPGVLLSPVTGVVADRVRRPRLLLLVCLGQAVVAAPLLVDAALCWLVMALQTSLAAFFEPARNALVADLVPADRRTSANGLLSAGSNIARLVGAWLGGTRSSTPGTRRSCSPAHSPCSAASRPPPRARRRTPSGTGSTASPTSAATADCGRSGPR